MIGLQGFERCNSFAYNIITGYKGAEMKWGPESNPIAAGYEELELDR